MFSEFATKACQVRGFGIMSTEDDKLEASDSTVETPSRLMLFYPDSTLGAVASLIPTHPICKPLGQRLTLGRSSSSDVRLNDERMSRTYAGFWHDGRHPAIFRVVNLSDRKSIIVNGVLLRQQEEAEVKDGSEVTLDFLKLRARVCAGDLVTSTYQVDFVKDRVTFCPPIKSLLESSTSCHYDGQPANQAANCRQIAVQQFCEPKQNLTDLLANARKIPLSDTIPPLSVNSRWSDVHPTQFMQGRVEPPSQQGDLVQASRAKILAIQSSVLEFQQRQGQPKDDKKDDNDVACVYLQKDFRERSEPDRFPERDLDNLANCDFDSLLNRHSNGYTGLQYEPLDNTRTSGSYLPGSPSQGQKPYLVQRPSEGYCSEEEYLSNTTDGAYMIPSTHVTKGEGSQQRFCPNIAPSSTETSAQPMAERRKCSSSLLSSSITSPVSCCLGKDPSCWFNLNLDPSTRSCLAHVNFNRSQSSITSDNLVSEKRCTSLNAEDSPFSAARSDICSGVQRGSDDTARLKRAREKLLLEHMVKENDQGQGRREAIEGEWDTDDPNINSYMT